MNIELRGQNKLFLAKIEHINQKKPIKVKIELQGQKKSI